MKIHRNLDLEAEEILKSFAKELASVKKSASHTQQRLEQLATVTKLLVPFGAGYSIFRKFIFRKKTPKQNKFSSLSKQLQATHFSSELSPIIREAIIFILSNLVFKSFKK